VFIASVKVTVAFYVSALLLDDALLKCVVSEVVSFSIVAIRTLTFQKVF